MGEADESGFTILSEGDAAGEPVADIVFVHGLGGHPSRTWTYEPNHVFWPKAVLPDDLHNARILTYGYKSNPANLNFLNPVSEASIYDHSMNFLSDLADQRAKSPNRPIIFVAHSLGGILVKDALKQSLDAKFKPVLQSTFPSTAGIIFFGTPHRGSSWTSIAEKATIFAMGNVNKRVLRGLSVNSTELQRLSDAFAVMLKENHFRVHSFTEGQSMSGIPGFRDKIVDDYSSIIDDAAATRFQLDANHLSMCKFRGKQDANYTRCLARIREFMDGISQTRRTGMASAPLPMTAPRPIESQRLQHHSVLVGSSDQNPPQKAFHVIPFAPNEDIVRRQASEDLDLLLPPADKHYSAAIWGLGGSGKTQIALDYAYRRCRDPTCSVFWVHADDETAFVNDYISIAGRFDLDMNLESERLLAAVRDCIQSQPQWLLILDNADNLSLFGVGQTLAQSINLHKYIPTGPTGTILWTSRDEQIVGTLVGARRGIPIAKMTFEEAKSLLETVRNKAMDNDDLEDAKTLLRELEYLPLAISQAGAYMRLTETPIRTYLSKLSDGMARWRVLRESQFDRHRRPDVANSVLETWDISIQRILQQQKTAYQVLHTVAYLDSQSIPYEAMIAAGTFCEEKLQDRQPETSEQMERSIKRLKDFSFVRPRITEGTSRSFEMHALVQEAILYRLSIARNLPEETLKQMPEKDCWDNEGEVQFSSAALHVVATLFPERERETWDQCERYVIHAIRVTEWAEKCGKEAEAANLLDRVSRYLYDRGNWAEKETVDNRALCLRKTALGEDHLDTIWSMGSLAATYSKQGRYKEAEELHVKVLTIRQNKLGREHADTIWSMGELAMAYHGQGRYDEAQRVKSDTLELRRKVSGENQPDTIWSMSQMAESHYVQGRYKEAKELFTTVLRLRQQLLGETHRDTISSMGDLVVIHHVQGRYKEAEELLAKVLELRRELLGEKHPDTIASMRDLAAIYFAQGRYEEAEQGMTTAIGLQRETIGERHPTTISSTRELILIYHAQGHYDKAKQGITKVLKLQEDILGQTHPDTMSSREVLASIYHAQGDYNIAEQTYSKVLALRREILGEKHPETIASIGDLAAIYYTQGYYDKARQGIIKALELQKEIFGEKHPYTISTIRELAAINHAQGRYDEAKKGYTKVRDLRREILGEKHPETISSIRELAELQGAQGQCKNTSAVNEQRITTRIWRPWQLVGRAFGRAMTSL